MAELAVLEKRIPAMSKLAVDKVRQLENVVLKAPQTDISTEHLFHAGVYARTITIPKGVVLTGALIKLATVLIIFGDIFVYLGDKSTRFRGYNVIPASANRKQAFLALSDVYMTMLFRSDAKSVLEAEEEFTDEAHLLFSRHKSARNHTVVTGE